MNPTNRINPENKIVVKHHFGKEIKVLYNSQISNFQHFFREKNDCQC